MEEDSKGSSGRNSHSEAGEAEEANGHKSRRRNCSRHHHHHHHHDGHSKSEQPDVVEHQDHRKHHHHKCRHHQRRAAEPGKQAGCCRLLSNLVSQSTRFDRSNR
uniref:Uncharacterized protein n=1 Tax=Anopheles albimanus TaxID=7167 RepID=A0A182FY48_ANOAL